MFTPTEFGTACDAWLENGTPSDVEFTKLLNMAFAVLASLTPRDLAVYLKIDESTVSRWMEGSTHPHPLIQRKTIQHLRQAA